VPGLPVGTRELAALCKHCRHSSRRRIPSLLSPPAPRGSQSRLQTRAKPHSCPGEVGERRPHVCGAGPGGEQACRRPCRSSTAEQRRIRARSFRPGPLMLQTALGLRRGAGHGRSPGTHAAPRRWPGGPAGTGCLCRDCSRAGALAPQDNAAWGGLRTSPPAPPAQLLEERWSSQPGWPDSGTAMP